MLGHSEKIIEENSPRANLGLYKHNLGQKNSEVPGPRPKTGGILLKDQIQDQSVMSRPC